MTALSAPTRRPQRRRQPAGCCRRVAAARWRASPTSTRWTIRSSTTTTTRSSPTRRSPISRNVRFVLVYSPFRPVVNVSYALDRGSGDYRPLRISPDQRRAARAAVRAAYAWLRRISDAIAWDARGARTATRGGVCRRGPLRGPSAADRGGRPMCRADPSCCARSGSLARAAVVARRDAVAASRAASGRRHPACGAAGARSRRKSASCLPVVVLAYDWLLLPGDDAARRRRLWRIFVPAFVTARGMRCIALMALRGGFDGAARRRCSTCSRRRSSSGDIWDCWLAGRSVDHARVHRVDDDRRSAGWAAFAGLARRGVAAFRLRRHIPLVAFGVALVLRRASRRPRASSRFAKGWRNIECIWRAPASSLVVRRGVIGAAAADQASRIVGVAGGTRSWHGRRGRVALLAVSVRLDRDAQSGVVGSRVPLWT